MAFAFAHMEVFDESVKPWTTYIERFEHFVKANSIAADKKVPVLLRVIGGKTYGLLRSLVAPDKPGEKSFKHITDTLQQHFSPKPLIIANFVFTGGISWRATPAIFQRAMDHVLPGLSNVHCYLDDILVTRQTEAEHLENLDAVLGHLKQFGLHVE
ncbi:hypothetical protein QTP70_022677, partial [Hemibagrus guttatus]